MSAVSRPAPGPASAGAGAHHLTRGWRSSRRPAGRPLAWTTACVAAAILSWALLPTVPSYDPWAWIVWGREVSDPHLAFVLGGGPSWKPLPFLFTALYGLFGAAAPTLWVVSARAAGLLGLVAAARLTLRLAPGRAAGRCAAALAVAGIVLTQDWGYYMMRGASEPGLIAATLWAVERRLAGRPRAAWRLAVAASLIRPEWWPFLVGLAAWTWRERSDGRLAGPEILAGLTLVPVLWFGLPWIGSGSALLAARNAALYDGHLGADPLRAAVARGLELQPSPAIAGTLVAALAGRRGDRRLTWLAGAALAWWIVVVAMTLDGYPGLERFFLPAAALVCVLGPVGFVIAARAVAGRIERPGAGLVVLVVLVGASVPLVTGRAGALAAQLPAARHARTLIAQLDRAAERTGGRVAAYPCGGRSLVAVNHSLATALAWTLEVPLARVRGVMTRPGLDFVGPHVAAAGQAPRLDPRLTRAEPVLRVGTWRVVRRLDPRRPALGRCVGR